MRSPYGRRLAEARRTRGLTRESAAVATGKSYSSIAAYESGQVVPPVDVLLVLAQVYGVTLGSLVGEVTSDVA